MKTSIDYKSPQTEIPMGTHAGTGRYRCTCCGTYVAVLRDPNDQLPPCDNCGSRADLCYLPDDDDARIS